MTMKMSATIGEMKDDLQKAANYLSEKDSVLAPVITRAGLAEFEPHSDYYGALVSSIIGQQLSVKAASSIKKRFRDLFDGKMPEPKTIIDTSIEELRSAGLSGAKAKYVQDLAQHVIDNKIDFATLNKLSNKQVIAVLTDVKGIGEWTAHMFMMFCMGRMDVLPVGDLGIRNGIRALYDLKDAPSPEQITEIAANHGWHPYESVASWYIWQSLDNAPK